MKVLRARACAKVNLGLAVLGKFPDGYHELQTCFDELDFGEDLRFYPDPPGTWPRGQSSKRCAEPFRLDLCLPAGAEPVMLPADLPRGAENLVLRAANALRDAWELEISGRFELDKLLPTGAGLGGGSADAAAALRLVALASGRALQSDALDELEVLARELGADVPFFIRGGRAQARGRGDRIQALSPLPRKYYALLLPGFSCQTAAVFSRWHRGLADRAKLIARAEELGSEPENRQLAELGFTAVPGLHNDLLPAAELAYPRLRELRLAILEAGISAMHLSGSGSTLFFVHEDPQEVVATVGALESLVARLRAVGSECLGPAPRIISSVSRDPGERALEAK